MDEGQLVPACFYDESAGSATERVDGAALSDDGTRPVAAPRDALDASTASNVKAPGRRDGTAK